jgi:hypothetical protein
MFRVRTSDPVAYILSVNVERRSLNAGQKAMAYAFAYPEATRYRRGGKSSKLEGLSEGRVS